MKHSLKVTLLLVGFFLVAQLFGLFTINQGMTIEEIVDPETNQTKTVIEHEDTAIGESPSMTPLEAMLYIVFAITIGTILLLILIKFKAKRVWKAWFFLAVWMTITITLGVYLQLDWLAYVIAFGLALWKLYRPNVLIHNTTEIFMYTGIGVLFVRYFTEGGLLYAFVLLLLISIYDAYAVWKSKHMVKMAQFQNDSQVFAGLSIPYKLKDFAKAKLKPKPKPTKKAKVTVKPTKTETSEHRTAILGGGDIAFPLIFSGAVMQWLILSGISKMSAFWYTQIVTIGVTAALLWLLIKGEKDKFYPAMPFLSAGCLLGFLIVYLLV